VSDPSTERIRPGRLDGADALNELTKRSVMHWGYDPAFLALRQSRVEDDPSLPMREWERPLQKADWNGVANDCAAMLGKSKDLQLAAWLCDAWVRQHQIEGLNAGADVLIGMVERHWDGLHPLIEDGDSDSRVAPFVWLNESLPLTLRLHVPLVFLPDRKPPTLNLADWDQIVIANTTRDPAAALPFTREQLIALMDARNLHWLSDMREQLQLAQQKWDTLARGLDERLALDAPSLGKVADTLRKLERACISLLDGRDPRAPANPAPAAQTAEPIEEETPMSAEPATFSATAFAADTPLPSGGVINSRQDAYRMLEAAAAYKALGLDFAKHAVAVTGPGSELDKYAIAQGWLARFPMWDWVGGRTSVMSAVGTIAAALQGVDVRGFLAGAAAMDVETRSRPAKENAAMLVALMWYSAGKGKGLKDMVVLPYKDRLVLFSKYLQQLVMESLGKEHDLDGNVVNQGIAVYGNKGSTDQHAYVQQLRDGVNNFFATFIEVAKDRDTVGFEVEPGYTSGDYLQGFLRGTRKALADKGRESITLTISEVSAYSLGLLVGLFERAVSFYATLVNVNAYHQPGVEAGKKAATDFLKQMSAVLAALTSTATTAEALAAKVGIDAEDAWHMLNHLAANGRAKRTTGVTPAEDTFTA